VPNLIYTLKNIYTATNAMTLT